MRLRIAGEVPTNPNSRLGNLYKKAAKVVGILGVSAVAILAMPELLPNVGAEQGVDFSPMTEEAQIGTAVAGLAIAAAIAKDKH